MSLAAPLSSTRACCPSLRCCWPASFHAVLDERISLLVMEEELSKEEAPPPLRYLTPLRHARHVGGRRGGPPHGEDTVL